MLSLLNRKFDLWVIDFFYLFHILRYALLHSLLMFSSVVVVVFLFQVYLSYLPSGQQTSISNQSSIIFFYACFFFFNQMSVNTICRISHLNKEKLLFIFFIEFLCCYSIPQIRYQYK